MLTEDQSSTSTVVLLLVFVLQVKPSSDMNDVGPTSEVELTSPSTIIQRAIERGEASIVSSKPNNPEAQVSDTSPSTTIQSNDRGKF